MSGPPQPLRYPHVISGRLSDEQIERALSLRSTFEGNTWAEVLRWVFDDPEVGDLIATRVRAR